MSDLITPERTNLSTWFRDDTPVRVADLCKEHGIKRAKMLRYLIRFALNNPAQLRRWMEENEDDE